MTSQTDTDKLARLPRWAQDRIRTLESSLDAANERLSAGPDDSDTFADPYARFDGSQPQPLGKGVDVEYRVPGQRYGFIVKMDQDGDLKVQGEGPMQLDLSASNVVTVRLRP